MSSRTTFHPSAPSGPRIPLWLDLRKVPVNKRLPYFKAAKAVDAEAILLGKDDPHLDRDDTVRVDGNHALKRGTTAIGRYVTIRNPKDQDRAAAADGIVVVEGADWTIIPLENLIAARRDRPGTLYALARSAEEAVRFRHTLETGVHGIVLAPDDVDTVHATDAALRDLGLPRIPTPERIHAAQERHGTGGTADAPTGFLEAAIITHIEDAGIGDRVCVDTTSLFRPGEGLLVGSTARGFVLVHAETIEDHYVRARPFRVNAGAIHSYLYAPGGKTQYLSELHAGSPVLAVHADGVYRVLRVGRAKIERRPHTLVAWETGPGDVGSAVLQTAETIRLVRPDGSTVAVTELQVGDQVLVHVEQAARHFGMPVEEHLEER